MLMIEPAMSVRFSGVSFDPSTSSRRLSHSGNIFISWNKFQSLRGYSCMGRNNRLVKSKVRASVEENSGPPSSPIKQNAKPSRYHPSEDIAEPELVEGGEARLTPAETARTIIEVKNDEDILQSLTGEDNLVQVIVGLDTAEMLSEMELSGSSEIDFGIEEIDDEDTDVDDEDDDEDEDGNDDEDYDEDWVSVLEDEEDQSDSDESLGDWAKLETMRSSHPMYFAKKMAEVVSDDPVDFMDQPPVGLAIQGLLRPAFIEEHSVIQKHMTESDYKAGNAEFNEVQRNVKDNVEDLGIINGNKGGPGLSQDGLSLAEELDKDESLGSRSSFYKLEMIKIQLISADGHQTVVEIEDFRKAQPDGIAHSAAKIISRLKAGGEKITQALKSLCGRCRGIQVEEATLIGIDTLGFDLRICSGTQVETLRFTFKTRASSEYSAERQMNDLLFPRTHNKLQQKKESHQTEL